MRSLARLAFLPIALVVFSGWIMGLNIQEAYYRVFLRIAPEHALLKLTQEVNGLIQYGQCPSFLDEESILELGYGQCGNYVALLSPRLTKLGITGRTISNWATSGNAHAVIEATWNNNRLVLDPTLGVIYPHSYLDLLQNPQLANDMLGSIPPELSSYGGSDFYGKVAVFDRRPDPTVTAVPSTIINAQLMNNMLKIKWPKGIRAQYISLTFVEDVTLRLRNWDRGIARLRLNPSNIAIPAMENDQITIQVTSDKNLTRDDVLIDVYAPKRDLSSILPLTAPLTTYVGFENGRALIDTISLEGEEGIYFFMDVGDLSSESRPMAFLNSLENVGRQSNTWGGIVTRNGVTYRAADQSIMSDYGHAVISFSPLVRGIETDRKLKVVVCYLKDDEGKPTSVKLYNLISKQYVELGQLKNSPSHRCDRFPVSRKLILATLGSQHEDSLEPSTWR